MAITKTQIKKWNDNFKKLSKPEKRVTIAKDVIKQIKLGKYYANKGDYVSNMINYGYLAYKDIQSNFDKVKCSVCALGSAMLSCSKFTNKLTFDDAYDLSISRTAPLDKLRKFFSDKQLVLIEAAFEGCPAIILNYSITTREIEFARDFFHGYTNDEDRLIAIMNNIIKNKGTFKL